jgi:hypothetical protein
VTTGAHITELQVQEFCLELSVMYLTNACTNFMPPCSFSAAQEQLDAIRGSISKPL